MNRFRRTLCLLPLILIITASSTIPVFAESGTVFTFTLQDNEIGNDSYESDSDTAPATINTSCLDKPDSGTAPPTGDTSCLRYLISAVCAGSAAVLCYIKFRRMKREKP